VWRWGCGIALAGGLLLTMLAVLGILLAIFGEVTDMEGLTGVGDRILLVRIDGMIVAGESGFTFMGGAATGSDEVVEQIERATDEPAIKGILLRINSPGGSAAGSQEIYDAIVSARQQGVIVVTSMADVAASGGYYVAAPSDHIFANPATVTGSIGVIAIHQDMSGLLQKVGIKSEVIKSGELKDMLGPTAPLSDKARAVVDALVKQVYEQFAQAVVDGREDLSREQVDQLADGRVYTGQQAVENGLIDDLGGMQHALEKAGELAGIVGKPELEEVRPPSLLRWLFGSGSQVQQRPVAVTGGLLYDGFAARLVQGAADPTPAAPGDL
jgi:protease-4